MTTEEKIESKNKKIEAARKRIKSEQDKIAVWQKEIDTLKSLEIKGVLQEINLPFDEVMKALKAMQNLPVKDGEEKADN